MFSRITNNKRVLCVCQCNTLRSPTMAIVLANPPFNHDTRSCGTDSYYSPVTLDTTLLRWADEIVCADTPQFDVVMRMLQENMLDKAVLNLRIPDKYMYRSPELVDLIKDRYPKKLANREKQQEG